MRSLFSAFLLKELNFQPCTFTLNGNHYSLIAHGAIGMDSITPQQTHVEKGRGDPVHPITATEVIVAGAVLAVFVLIALFTRWRGRWLTVLSLTVVIVAFFSIRPLWEDHQRAEQKAELETHLKQAFPDEEWTIYSQEGRQYSTSQFDVVFRNEEERLYSYSVGEGGEICQNGWGAPEDELPEDGRHYRDECN